MTAIERLHRVWLPACRPRTLPAALAPVLIGTAMAWHDGGLYAPAALGALAGALLLQIGTNFANDYFDFVNGADNEERLGPPRATHQGWVTPAAMRWAFVAVFGLAAVTGLALVTRGGWPIAVIGGTGIACGILYTGGPRPLGYLGLGDVLVLVYFGPVAVAGTHYVQTLAFSPRAALAGLAPGAIATALLAVNNLRDVDSDRRAGKRTLAVRLGPAFAKAEYAAALAVAAAIPALLWWLQDGPAWGLLASAATVSALPALRDVLRARPGDRLLGALAGTGRLLALYGVITALAWVLG